jgi:hypothetical protein
MIQLTSALAMFQCFLDSYITPTTTCELGGEALQPGDERGLAADRWASRTPLCLRTHFSKPVPIDKRRLQSSLRLWSGAGVKGGK